MNKQSLQTALLDALAASLAAGGGQVDEYNTHISRVLVANGHAYKFKKAVRLPFLDFSSLEARHFYCEEEVRLNRRLAPQLYEGVVPVTGSIASPVLEGSGRPLDYAVKMRAFAQDALWSRRLARGAITYADIEGLARALAGFHLAAAVAPDDSAWGGAATIAATSDENFSELSSLVDDVGRATQLAELQAWETEERLRVSAAFARRKAQGMVRECHGDLHCANILTLDGKVEIFDCIEFSDSLRWIDVMNDLSFACMDLAFRGRQDLSMRLLNQYLELSGDYDGLSVFRYYLVHRALVRAKVALLHASDAHADEQVRREERRSALDYLAFAHARIVPAITAVMITHGLSGSGKSTFARHAVGLLEAIQLRSDVERKRLHGMPPTARPDATTRTGLYGESATEAVYARLRELAHDIVSAGWPVIVDAVFLRAEQRVQFRRLADALGIGFLIFDVRAGRTTMERRIASREAANQDASDADLAVLKRQLARDEALTPAEMDYAVTVDMDKDFDSTRVAALLGPARKRLQRQRE